MQIKQNKRKCKHCKLEFVKLRPLQSTCGVNCAIAHANILKEKNKRLEALKSRRETKEKLLKLKTRQEWLADAQRFFNIYIRVRDAHLPCISCQRFHRGQYHAGHYRSVGSAPHLRFNEQNVHKQCSACNNYLSGNIQQYRKNLLGKIGEEALDRLEANNEARNLSIDEIKAIKVKYKQLTKQLEDK